jgi:carboxymethylenebutenolidase
MDHNDGLVEHDVQLMTDEGTMGTYVVHPTDPGPHPLVLFLMDAPGKRELLHSMARHIAGRGYFVMLPNLYYRSVEAFELDFSSKESFARMSELMRGVGNRMVGRDAGALIAYAAGHANADAERVGVVGYCMSGPFAVWVAAEHTACVKAAASFYGVRLHIDDADSPHLRLGEITGELYVAAAEHDDYVPLDMIDRFEAALQIAGTKGRVERYWGMHHGFAFDDRPAHDPVGEARHWERLLDLFDRNLRNH